MLLRWVFLSTSLSSKSFKFWIFKFILWIFAFFLKWAVLLSFFSKSFKFVSWFFAFFLRWAVLSTFFFQIIYILNIWILCMIFRLLSKMSSFFSPKSFKFWFFKFVLWVFAFFPRWAMLFNSKKPWLWHFVSTHTNK